MTKKDDAAEAATPQKAELITVKSTLAQLPDGGNPVALSESHPDHPGGEAYVAGDKPVQVAKTPGVLKRIAEGVLVEVTGKEAKAAKPEETK